MDEEKPKYKRRVRYKGTHPKSFKEKYKEQQPALYAADIAKLIDKGRTPAGMHRAVCVNEIVEVLKILPGQTGLDATLGYGGHSLEILKRLQPGGFLYATDVDPFELPRTRQRLNDLGYGPAVLAIKQMNFSDIDKIVAEAGPLDFILADLGLSSMQIDNPERGFSLKTEAPLDLRLDPTRGKPAAALLKSISKIRLEEMLIENADEPFYEIIAQAIISHLSTGIPVTTTTQLKDIITSALEALPQKPNIDDIRKSCQRCFQALRIEVNNELGVLDQFLEKLPDALSPHGRVAIISFHSGEDRRVKKAFQYFFREGIYSEIAPGPVRASREECFTNRRARSAKLRWAIKA